MFEAIGLETLNNFFNGHPIGEKLEFKNIPCAKCGRPVNIEIQKTSAGYGFLNGILAEPNGGRLLAQCVTCYGNK